MRRIKTQFRPEAIDVAHPAPQRPTGKRWTNDPGSMPDEPILFLDGKTEEDSRAAIVEVPVDEGSNRILYEALTSDGNSLGQFSTVQEATEAAEYHFPINDKSRGIEMDFEEEIKRIIKYLYDESVGYVQIGGSNEAWGLRHAAKKLENMLKLPPSFESCLENERN